MKGELGFRKQPNGQPLFTVRTGQIRSRSPISDFWPLFRVPHFPARLSSFQGYLLDYQQFLGLLANRVLCWSFCAGFPYRVHGICPPLSGSASQSWALAEAPQLPEKTEEKEKHQNSSLLKTGLSPPAHLYHPKTTHPGQPLNL